MPLAELDEALNDPRADAAALLRLGEQSLEHWVNAHGQIPTNAEREGFRLLALHRQGAKDDPSFNACRETCRELAYYFNLAEQQPDHAHAAQRIQMMRFVARHLFLFVSGKLEEQKLGDFCCASRPLRVEA